MEEKVEGLGEKLRWSLKIIILRMRLDTNFLMFHNDEKVCSEPLSEIRLKPIVSLVPQSFIPPFHKKESPNTSNTVNTANRANTVKAIPPIQPIQPIPPIQEIQS